MEIHKIIILSSFVTTSFLSCPQPQHFYKPVPIDAVLLSHKNQVMINGIVDASILRDQSMGTVSLSYSPTNDLGLRVGLGSGSNGNDDFTNPYISAGYYKNLSHDFLAEIYGGFGMYYHSNTYYESEYAPIKRINYNNYFIQPSIAFINKNIEAALTLRFDYLRRQRTEILADYDASEWKYSFLKYNNYMFLQPGLTVKAGWKKVKFVVGVSKSIPFNKNYSSIYGPDENYFITSEKDIPPADNKFHISTGLSINLDLFTNKKKK